MSIGELMIVIRARKTKKKPSKLLNTIVMVTEVNKILKDLLCKEIKVDL